MKKIIAIMILVLTASAIFSATAPVFPTDRNGVPYNYPVTVSGSPSVDLDGTSVGARMLAGDGSPLATEDDSGDTTLKTIIKLDNGMGGWSFPYVNVNHMGAGGATSAQVVDSTGSSIIVYNVSNIGGSPITNPNSTTWTADGQDVTFTAVAIVGMPADFYYAVTSTSAVLLSWASNLIDTISNAFVVIDMAHRLIHQGLHYYVIDTEEDVDIAETCKLWTVKTSTDTLHISDLLINASKAGYYSVYEAPTVSSNGTALTWRNNNFASANTTSMVAYANSITTSAGTLKIPKSYVPGSSGGTPNSTQFGGSVSNRRELIFKASTTYLIRFEPLNDDTIVTMEVAGYER